jgi:hypothetical protein
MEKYQSNTHNSTDKNHRFVESRTHKNTSSTHNFQSHEHYKEKKP